MPGEIRVGIGGWTFEPWRGVFYPEGLPHKRELEFASRALTSIEINGTFYSTFKPDSWRKWRDETPDDFVFAVKGSRYCTNRKVLGSAAPSLDKFFGQGLTELGAKLGPINWQLAATKQFDPDDIDAFFSLLPKELGGLRLRHAIEVRHESFLTPAFYGIARDHGVAIVHAQSADYPEIAERTADFTYARIMKSREDETQGVSKPELQKIVKAAHAWSKHGDAFVYFISAAKVRNPAAAATLIAALAKGRPK